MRREDRRLGRHLPEIDVDRRRDDQLADQPPLQRVQIQPQRAAHGRPGGRGRDRSPSPSPKRQRDRSRSRARSSTSSTESTSWPQQEGRRYGSRAQPGGHIDSEHGGQTSPCRAHSTRTHPHRTDPAPATAVEPDVEVGACERTVVVEDDGHRPRPGEEPARRGLPRASSPRDGERGLELVADKKPDLVLLDVMLPQLNGFELLRVVRRRRTRSRS